MQPHTIPNALDLGTYVGRTGRLVTGDLKVDVRVINARTCWQRVDVQVTPVAGDGTQWVSLARVALSPAPTSKE